MMKELNHLKSMWGEKVRRRTDLIVPEVTYKDGQGSLNNEYWAFSVPYAFRDALDIRFEERKKNRQSYMTWTQGPILSFKEGDFFHSADGKRAVQVRFAHQMGWDASKGEMYQGSVVYSDYSVSGNSLSKRSEHTCTQMQFLQLLISGAHES
jgi:hypothetical protein